MIRQSNGFHLSTNALHCMYLDSRGPKGSTYQAYSSGFYFKVSWMGEIYIFGQNFSFLIFESVNFIGFLEGPAKIRLLTKNKVFSSIYLNFGSRNPLNKLNWLTPQDLYYIVQYYIHKRCGTANNKWRVAITSSNCFCSQHLQISNCYQVFWW